MLGRQARKHNPRRDTDKDGTMSDELDLVAVVTAPAEARETIETAIAACVAETRKEAGCRHYVAHRDRETAGRFVFIERWESRAALDAHMAEPHFKALARTFEEVGASLEVMTLQALG